MSEDEEVWEIIIPELLVLMVIAMIFSLDILFVVDKMILKKQEEGVWREMKP